MYVRRLTLHDFRSWDDVTVDLEPGVSVLVGRNGFGKTNLVEALNYLATLGSHRVATDQPLIRVGAESASVAATVHNAGRELTAEIDIVAGRANKARINTAPCRRPRELLGILQSVLFAPEDLALVRGEPGGRRRFLDDLAILRTPRIAAEKADYERVLKQRTALLKTAYAAARRGGPDADSMLSTLDVWDEQLARFGAEVLAARLEVVSSLAPHLTVAYAALAPHSRAATVAYTSSLFEGFDGDPAAASVAELEQLLRSGLAAARQREIERGVCLVGPHRDDLGEPLGDPPEGDREQHAAEGGDPGRHRAGEGFARREVEQRVDRPPGHGVGDSAAGLADPRQGRSPDEGVGRHEHDEGPDDEPRRSRPRGRDDDRRRGGRRPMGRRMGGGRPGFGRGPSVSDQSPSSQDRARAWSPPADAVIWRW